MGTMVEKACDGCGSAQRVPKHHFISGTRPYCRRCASRKKAGLRLDDSPSYKGTQLYGVWRAMRERCGLLDYRVKKQEIYGDRGIGVCKEWAESCHEFVVWAMAHGFEPGLYLDRENNDRGYGPDNCRWVTAEISGQNKRSSLPIGEVAFIKARLLQGVKQHELVKTTQANRTTISSIALGKRWSNIVPLQG